MKYAFCNEPFKDQPFDETCRILAEIGYDGIELAPFTFGEDIRKIDKAQRTRIRRTAEDHGLEVVGVHWLLITPKGFHLTIEDETVRGETTEFMKAMCAYCRNVGGKVLIHGSPAQRNLEPTQDRAIVEERTIGIFREVGEEAERLGVVYCLEALDTKQTNFIKTPEEAYRMVERVNRPGFQMMLDSRASFAMGLEPAEELRNWIEAIRHIHLNDTNLLGPGMGDHDFEPLFEAGRDLGFHGYYSVEPFDYTPGAETLARESYQTIRRLHDKVY